MSIKILVECPGCGRRDIRHGGLGLCARCYTRRRRSDPVKAERDRESSRKWKREHRNHDKRPSFGKRGPNDRIRAFDPDLVRVYPSGNFYCRACGNNMLDPEIICGFCIIELDPYDKLRAMELLPGQDEEWTKYFSLLANHELQELIEQAQLERGRRLQDWGQKIIPRQELLYGSELPPHHRRNGETSAHSRPQDQVPVHQDPPSPNAD